jgi:competence protein ComEC
MFRWIPFVFVRVVLFFIAGILLGVYLADSISERIVQSLLVFFAALYFVLYLFKNRLSIKIDLGFIGLIIIFLSGYLLLLIRTDSRDAQHFIHLQQPVEYYTATIDNYTQEKDKSWKVEAVVEEVRIAGNWCAVKGKVLLYFSKDDFERPFSYGDRLLITGSPVLLMPPGNPGEFDYKRFLTFRKIYHQHFLRGNAVTKIDYAPPSLLYSYALQARLWADAKLRLYVKGEREYGIASALALGVTDGLDNDIMQAYSATGALHVLSVSGLHVGIIYWILLLLLKPLSKQKRGKWILAFVSLVVLWSYAFITGLSPSVMRAVTMFSFVAFARPLQWTTNIYNTLAVSAFCLLLYEPYLIMSVGFQLSYIAVLGIVYLQRPLYQWWETPNWLLDKIWQVTTVSIAAQIATVSLGLLYFHQFPVYFIFSNLLVIPVSFIVLVLGLAVPLFSFIPALASILGWLLTGSIKIMNASVTMVEALPYSLIDNIFITTAQSWLIMLTLLSIILLLHVRKFYLVAVICSLITILSVTQWLHFKNKVDKKQLVVYKVADHTAIDFIETGKTYFLSDSILINDKEKMRFHIRPNRLMSETSTIELADDQSFVKKIRGGKLVRWHERIILIVDDDKAIIPNLTADYVILSNNAASLTNIIKRINFKYLIVDGSNSFYFADKVKSDADRLKIQVHSVLHQGAFIHSL